MTKTALADVPARSIVAAIAHAAQRWCDADFPPRVRALNRIVERTGYCEPAVEYALDRLFETVMQHTLEAAIRAEIGSLDVLDGFVENEGLPDAWAAPIGRVCVLSSRTTIGVALIPAIFALCAKCDVAVKDREDALLNAFFETLAQEREEFARAAVAAPWHPGDHAAPDLRTFDAVVAFGSDQTLATIAPLLDPGARFIGYGSRASAGYVARDALTTEAHALAVARGAARDLVLYESEGCLSLHVLFVERAATISLEAFGRILGHCVEEANVEFPPGRCDPAVAAKIAHLRDVTAFRAASAGSGGVISDDGATFAILVNQPARHAPAFLPRTLAIIGVDAPAQALAYLREHRLPLEGFALAGERPEAVAMALESGAVRLARFGELQHPPLGGHHGGRQRIADFIRWIDKTL